MRAIDLHSQLARRLLENEGVWERRGQPLACLLGMRGRRPRSARELRPWDKPHFRRGFGSPASTGGRAARVGGSWRAFAALLGLGTFAGGCALASREPAIPGIVVATAAEGEGTERSCAWYGDARDGVLYFGESAFWSVARAQGDPLADALAPGPRRIGRFDLATRRLAAPLDAGPGDRPTGVWDVLAHANGRVYFTTWFDSMGWVDARTGAVHDLGALGRGLNEIAPGPGDTLLISRYGSPSGGPGPGSVLLASLGGERLAEHPLAAPPGYRVGPKTVAFDPARDEIWVTTDLFPLQGGAIRHDAYVLDRSGREKRRIESPEVQFAAFRPDGSGLLAEVAGSRLELRVRTPDAPDRVLLADTAFAAGLDFVQDIHFAEDGRAVVTRWSGVLHVFEPPASLETLVLPRVDPQGLYYSGVLAGDHVCATHCGGVTVVCAPADPTAAAPLR